MNITIKFEGKNVFEYANFKHTVEWNLKTVEKLAKATKETILYSLFGGLDFNMRPVKPKLKTSRHGSDRIFYDTGELFKSIAYQVTGINYAEIFVTGNRSQIAEWINKGTKYMVARPFFGVGETLKKLWLSILENDLKKNNV